MGHLLTSISESGSEYTLGAVTVGSTLSSHPRKATLGDLPNIMENLKLAFVDDPFIQYLLCEGEREPRWKAVLQDLLRMTTMFIHVEQGTGWVIDSGDSVMLYTDPRRPPKFYHKLLARFARLFDRVLYSKREIRREGEFSKKFGEAIEEVLGEKVKGMFLLKQLSTTPASQGRGYGSSLVKLFNAEADARQTPSYLLSSNVAANTGFYNSLGFFTVKEFILGEDDPDWDRPPVVMALMVRDVPDGDSKYRD